MLVQAEGLTKFYQGSRKTVRVLEEATLSVDSGEFVAVQGPSGCGKTTLLLMLGGLLRPSGGEVNVADVNPYDLTPEARAHFRAEKIGFVFQEFHLLRYLNVLENVLAPTLARPHPGAEERAGKLLERLNLRSRADHKPEALSTGERQRTALARAFLHSPSLILADEPTGNLDEENGRTVLACLKEFADEGNSIIMVTHDSYAARHADRVLHIENGKILEHDK